MANSVRKSISFLLTLLFLSRMGSATVPTGWVDFSFHTEDALYFESHLLGAETAIIPLQTGIPANVNQPQPNSLASWAKKGWEQIADLVLPDVTSYRSTRLVVRYARLMEPGLPAVDIAFPFHPKAMMEELDLAWDLAACERYLET